MLEKEIFTSFDINDEGSIHPINNLIGVIIEKLVSISVLVFVKFTV